MENTEQIILTEVNNEKDLKKQLTHVCIQGKTIRAIMYTVSFILILIALNTNLALSASKSSNEAQRDIYRMQSEMSIKIEPVIAELVFIRKSIDEIKIYIHNSPNTPIK